MSAKKNRLKARLRMERQRLESVSMQMIEMASKAIFYEHQANLLRERLNSFVNVRRVDNDRVLRFEFNLSELELQHASARRDDYARMVTEHAISQFEKRIP